MDVEIPELVPMDDYDARQARLESSMRWLLSKAYGGSIPLDYQESFFSLGLSSVLACRLTSSELYWMATCAMFPEVKGQTQQGHEPLIRFLVRRGVYLADVNGVEVNEKLLQRTSPIHLMAHITLLEGLMTAYINSTLTPEKVVPAVRKFASFSASSELPSNAEDAAMFWLNKTCASLCHHLKELRPSVCPESLTMNDIKDVNDGRCLAAVVGFYCPQELPPSAIELGDSLAIADSLYNLQLLHDFCRSHLNASLLTLTVMDLFYTPDTLHLNILAFYADLFHCLEVERASCVRDTSLPLSLGSDATETELQKTHVLSSPPVSRVVIPQISDPTKRSFLPSVSTSHSRPQSSTVNGTRRPLLPRRHSDARSAGGSNSNANQPFAEAWVPNSGVPASSGKGSVIVNASSGNSLLSNVMIDDSIDLNSLDSSHQSCDEEVGSLLQTLNEKLSSKAVDRRRRFDAPSTLGPLQGPVVGDNFASSNLPSDPLLPAPLRPSKEKLNSHSKKCEYKEGRGGGGGGQKMHEAVGDGECERSGSQGEASRCSSSSSTPIDEYKTPSVESVENNGSETSGKEIAPENNGFVAFASSEIEPGNENDSKPLCRSRLGGQSYVVRGRPTVVDDALAAGLPVVTSGAPSGSGCTTDGGFDQELHKLQGDFRDKEFSGRNGSRGCFISLGTDGVQLAGGVKKPPDKGGAVCESHPAENGSKTSFAQIKKQKEAEGISKGARDLGSIPEGPAGSHPARVPLLARPRKKTTFGTLPNQTTWVQESAQRVSERAAASAGEDAADPMPSELIGLRLKLEENRRLIEGRKRLTERQWHQQRQQMGKEAFIQVITKNKNGVELSGDEKSSATTEASNGAHRKVAVKSDERKTKAGTLPGRQSPNLKVIHEADVSSQDNLSQTVAHDQAESLPKVDTENQPLVVDSDSSLQVIGSMSKETVGEESSVSDVGAEPLPSHRSLHSNADVDEQKPYDASLDRINSSLTELQVEIQRLSRQQDQINKSLVRSDVGQVARGVSASARELQGREVHRVPQSSCGTTTTPTKDEFPGIQFSSARKAAPSAIGAGPLPMGAQNFLCTEIAMHQSRPSTGPYSVPSYPSAGMPFPPRYHPAPSVPLSTSHYQPYAGVPPVTVPAERMYPPLETGHRFVALGSQFHPSSGMYPVVPGMYPVSVPTSYGHYQGSVAHQQYPHLQNLSTLMHHPEFPPGLPPHEVPFAEFMQPPLPHTSPLSFQSPASWAGSQPIHGVSAETQNPHVQVQAADITANQDFGPSEGSDTWKTPVSVHHLPSSVQDLGDAGQAEVHPQAGGFFVDLRDSPTPTRQKPNLKARHKSKLKTNGCDGLMLDPVTSVSASPLFAEPPVHPSDPAPDDVSPDAKATPGNSETSPLVFVIGQSTENEDDWLEMEKRKQRLCEMQIKRQEEQELRREKLQREQERKRDQQRMKQELTEQKRAEEKARREAIFQSYLQKKKEKEMSEESPSKPIPPVIRRQRSAQQRGARPKSQPALPAEMTPTKAVPGIVGHSSHDNLMMDGAIAKTPASNFLRSDERVNSAQNEVPLAFGGLTHRRPPTPGTPTPDQNTPTAGQPTSDGSESSGSQMADNYTGPKLFVKPSQKSNRHIIINAISHCCLAGSVNKDVKDKVLEEIARSDAKHFIILFRDAAMQYRGLYTYNPEQEEVLRIHGVGPKQLTDKVMEKFYKYNSGSKKFSEITSTKHLTATIDAIAVLGTVWQKTRPAAPSKKPL